jgi:hypothetical protein
LNGLWLNAGKRRCAVLRGNVKILLAGKLGDIPSL